MLWAHGVHLLVCGRGALKHVRDVSSSAAVGAGYPVTLVCMLQRHTLLCVCTHAQVTCAFPASCWSWEPT
jgi:hypothetical protein